MSKVLMGNLDPRLLKEVGDLGPSKGSKLMTQTTKSVILFYVFWFGEETDLHIKLMRCSKTCRKQASGYLHIAILSSL